MPKQIELTQGKVAIVDDEDFEWLNQWKWYAVRRGTIWYAVRTKRLPKRRIIYMHRIIMEPPVDLQIDHQNMDGLDNRRCNLRICTRSQNLMNSKKCHLDHTSRFKGIYWNKRDKKWHARIGHKGHHIGYFDDELEAAKAYNKIAFKLFGEFARLNVIGE